MAPIADTCGEQSILQPWTPSSLPLSIQYDLLVPSGASDGLPLASLFLDSPEETLPEVVATTLQKVGPRASSCPNIGRRISWVIFGMGHMWRLHSGVGMFLNRLYSGASYNLVLGNKSTHF